MRAREAERSRKVRPILIGLLLGVTLTGCQTIDTATEKVKTAAEQLNARLETAFGNGGGFRPMCTYMTDTGTFCRDFEETLRVDSREDSYRNVACRRKTGGWVWVKN